MIIKKDRFLIVSPFPGAVHFEAVIGELSTFSFVCFFPSSLIVHSSMFNCHQLYAIYLDKKKEKESMFKGGGRESHSAWLSSEVTVLLPDMKKQ